MRCRAHSAAGFTLVELTVGIAVSAITLMAIALTFVAVHASFQAETEVKGATGNARQALGYLERTLRIAGYGIDPRAVFDFGTPGSGLDKNNQDLGGGAFTDDLAFRYREPAYLRRASVNGSSAPYSVDLTPSPTTLGIELEAGQPVIVACPGGQQYWVGRLATAAGSSATTLSVNAYGEPFSTLSSATPAPCMIGATGQSAAYLMLMHEVRVRIRVIDGRPYLLAFHGLDDANTSTDFDPIAADVESFQVSYVMNRPPTGAAGVTVPDSGGNANWILGDAAGESLPDPAKASPDYSTSYQDPNRFTSHPANIRTVRIGLSVRSARPEPTSRKAFGPVAFEDFTPASTTPDGLYRTFVHGAVRIPNMLSRSFFVPPLKSSSTDPTDLNVWGG